MGCNGLEILNPPNTPTWCGSHATNRPSILDLTYYILILPLLFLIPHHPFIYTPFYKVPNTCDCLTIVSKFPNTIPAHPLDILPCLAPKLFSL
jgi:hypothetical protein